MQITKTVPTKTTKVNTRGIVAEIARERGVHPNVVYMGLRRKSIMYIKRFNEIVEERKNELEKFEKYRELSNG